MKGRTTKHSDPKTLKEKENTSTIKQYLTKETSPKSPGLGKQQVKQNKKKKTLGKRKERYLINLERI